MYPADANLGLSASLCSWYLDQAMHPEFEKDGATLAAGPSEQLPYTAPHHHRHPLTHPITTIAKMRMLVGITHQTHIYHTPFITYALQPNWALRWICGMITDMRIVANLFIMRTNSQFGSESR
jgi:hypothetical protein